MGRSTTGPTQEEAKALHHRLISAFTSLTAEERTKVAETFYVLEDFLISMQERLPTAEQRRKDRIRNKTKVGRGT